MKRMPEGGISDQLRIGCRLQAAVAKSVYLGLYHSATGNSRCTNLLGEIVEIESLRHALFIVRNHKIRKGLRFRVRVFGVTELPLRLTLRFLGALFLPRALLLPFRECRSRASCHKVIVF